MRFDSPLAPSGSDPALVTNSCPALQFVIIHRQTATVSREDEHPGSTKPGKGRSVDLDPKTVAVLRSWRVARAGLDLRLARDDALIFGDLEGGHLNPDRFSRRFVRSLTLARRELGADALPMIRVHDLRHTHASVLLKRKVPVKVVSERLGHATVTITLETYQHVMPGMGADAAAEFAALVEGEAR